MQTLSNGNQLKSADGFDPSLSNGGVGALQTLPQVGGFSDGTLSVIETVDVPFEVCPQNLSPFRFRVNVLGDQ